MRTIILSPHLDDGAYSCGGWIWEQVRQGQEVIVCTLFAGSPVGIAIPPFAGLLQQTWGFQGDATTGRRAEDVAACEFLGCKWHHLEFLDCIYRYLPNQCQPLIHNLNDLSSPIKNDEYPLVEHITNRVRNLYPDDRNFLAPLGAGGHVDHRITRCVAERLGANLSYYLDLPYGSMTVDEFSTLLPAGARTEKYELSTQGMRAWQQAILLYPSQFHSFWGSVEDMETQITDFARSSLGCCFWKA